MRTGGRGATRYNPSAMGPDASRVSSCPSLRLTRRCDGDEGEPALLECDVSWEIKVEVRERRREGCGSDGATPPDDCAAGPLEPSCVVRQPYPTPLGRTRGSSSAGQNSRLISDPRP